MTIEAGNVFHFSSVSASMVWYDKTTEAEKGILDV
jgi:hypothetical protein